MVGAHPRHLNSRQAHLELESGKKGVGNGWLIVGNGWLVEAWLRNGWQADYRLENCSFIEFGAAHGTSRLTMLISL